MTRILAVVCAASVSAAVASTLAGCGGAGRHASATASTSSQATTTTADLPGTGRPPVVVGDKNTFPEQFILGDLYEQALAAQGYSVSLNRNIGPPEVTLEALENGSLDMYPEYIDDWDQSVAVYRRSFPSARAAYSAGQRFAAPRRLELLAPTPFSDTDGIAVTLSYGVKHELTTIGDLRNVASGLVIGGPPQFETGLDGLAGVEVAYGFAPVSFKTIAVGDQYHELDEGAIQAADVNTTDPQLGSGGYLLLADPRHVFGWGNVAPVVSRKIITEEGPDFARTIDAVSALLTTSVMRELNAAVAVSHENPVLVAAEFLKAHHLVPASQGS